jgi:hypothetical protein
LRLELWRYSLPAWLSTSKSIKSETSISAPSNPHSLPAD